MKEKMNSSEEKQESVFSKEQLINSKRFDKRKDILNAILSDEKRCTISEAEKLIDSYMKGAVR